MSELDRPEIPEPQKSAPEPEQPEPSSANGTGASSPDTQPVFMSQDGVVKWMEATDRELKLLRIQGLILSGAVILLLIATKPKLPISPPSA